MHIQREGLLSDTSDQFTGDMISYRADDYSAQWHGLNGILHAI